MLAKLGQGGPHLSQALSAYFSGQLSGLKLKCCNYDKQFYSII